MARNDRSVDVFVHKLRRKLKQASPEWDYVHTELRVGYRLFAKQVGSRAEPVALPVLHEREPAIALAA
jgi:DNA-binding winged helix-turn-helix (wHTH) protein